MFELFAVIFFLFGMAVAILIAIISIRKRNIFLNIFTVVYAFVPFITYSIVKNKPFDYIVSSMLAVLLLLIGWFEATREAREQRRRDKDIEARERRLSKWKDLDKGD